MRGGPSRRSAGYQNDRLDERVDLAKKSWNQTLGAEVERDARVAVILNRAEYRVCHRAAAKKPEAP